MDSWNTGLLLGWPIFRCYLSFRECILPNDPPFCLLATHFQTKWQPSCLGFRILCCVGLFVEVICSNALLNAFAQSSEWFKALIHLQYMRSTGETTVTWLLSLSWRFFGDGVRGVWKGTATVHKKNGRTSIVCQLILFKCVFQGC